MSSRKVWIATFLLAAALPLFAAPEVPDGKWWKRPRLAAEIHLTPEQSREIETIFVRTRTRLIDLKADLEKKQLALQSAMDDRSADRRAVERQIEGVETARAELQKTRAIMILDMKQVLTPEQWDRLRQLQQEMRERRQERRSGGR
ncbi:MAG: periplasmic heavy metal sensor [Acidobacteriota bacterium]